MDSGLERSALVERSFWASAVLALIGGIGPFVVAGGHTNRVAGVVFPFAAVAVAMGVLARTYRRGRGYGALIYLVAGLAIAYGLLFVLYVPVRLAVEGTCPSGTQCTAGFEPRLTSSEGLGINVAVAFGLMAWLAGSLGLVGLYRLHGARAAAPVAPIWPAHPPDEPVRSATKPDEAPAVAKANEEVAAGTAKPEPEAAPEPAPDPSPDSKPASNAPSTLEDP